MRKHEGPEKTDDQFLTLKEVTNRIGCSRATAYRWMADRHLRLPKGIKLSPRKRVWRLSSILEWMEAQERKAANDPVYREEG